MNKSWQLSIVWGAALAISLNGCAGRNPFTAFKSLPSFVSDEPEPDPSADLQPSYLGPPVRQHAEPTGFPANVTAAVKQAGASVSEALTIKPKVIPANDPINLNSDPGPLGPDLYVSAGQIHEQRGHFEAAKGQYQRALELAPNNLTALLSYARVHDRLEQFDEAIRIYQRTVDAHPNSSMALNDLGLCYARMGNLDQSIAALQHAVQLDPQKSLYRNNLARVLIEVGQARQAFDHLAAVSGPAIAHYNLGYFLFQRQQIDEAMYHFNEAARIDPALTAAREMLHRMGQVPPANRQSSIDPTDDAKNLQQVIYRVHDEESAVGSPVASDFDGVQAQPAVYVVEDTADTAVVISPSSAKRPATADPAVAAPPRRLDSSADYTSAFE